MIKKTNFIAAISFLMLAVAGAANAQPYNRYMTLQGALADVDGYDSGIAGVATYGVRVPEMHKNFAVEAEYAMTFIEPEGKVAGSTYEASYYSLGAYGVYAHPLNPQFHLRGRLGLAYSNVKTSSAAVSSSDDGFDLTYGLGITMDMGKGSRFILEYTVYDNDAGVNHISAGLQFKM